MFLRVIVPLLVVGLMVYALVDAWGADEDERGGLPRWLWVILIVLLPLLGPISWIVVRASARRSGGAGPSGPGPGTGGSRRTPPQRPGPRRPSGPVAPDDDPEFLWLLEQEKRKRERETRGSRDTKDDGAENS